MIIFSSDKYFKEIYEALTGAGFKIGALITEPPKPAGRGLKITKNPAHKFAEFNGLTVLTPEKLDNNFSESLATAYRLQTTDSPAFLFAYGKIIPPQLINIFKRGILNLHPSLLPKYRGATPIQSAILNNEKETGWSIIKISEGLDDGDIIYQGETKILSNDNYDSVREKIISAALIKLPRIVFNYIAGKIEPIKQNNADATLTSKIKKSDAEITKNDNAVSADCKIRAFSVWPKAYMVLNEKRVIVHKAHIEHDHLILDEIQVEGKNKINFTDFQRGYPNLLTFLPSFVSILDV